MDTINKKYNIEITVLSPLSIGAGAEKDLVKGMDFVVKEKRIYLLNLKKMVQNGIDPQELTTLYAEKDDDGLLKKIGSRLDKISDRIMDLPVNSDNNIKSFIKNELTNKPIIPGSSLKGAVRSVILEYLLQSRKSQRLDEKEYFGDSNKGDELMRFIKFSDAEFEDTTLVNTKIFNLRQTADGWLGGWKYSSHQTVEKFRPTGFNTLYEAILPNKKGVCSVMLAETPFKNIQNHSFMDKKLKLFSVDNLFKIINEHTKKYIDKELAFFEKYKADKTEEIVNNLKHLKAQILVDNSVCILKMSAGSGFHSITGDWQYEDYSKTGIWPNSKQKYKSRKVAIHDGIFSMMGFVKLRVMSDEEFFNYQEKQEHIKQQIATVKQAEQEKIRQEQEQKAQEQERKAQEEAEKQRQIENERLEKEQAAKAEQERLANMSPDDKEKEKYINAIQSEIGNLVNESIKNEGLTLDFYKWLKEYLMSLKLWKIDVNDKKNKWIKRCLTIEDKLK